MSNHFLRTYVATLLSLTAVLPETITRPDATGNFVANVVPAPDGCAQTEDRSFKKCELPIRPAARNVLSVSMLGNPGAFKWTRRAERLEVELSARKPCDYAFLFQIAGETLAAKPQVQE